MKGFRPGIYEIMSKQRENRRDKQVRQENPINVTCGKCGKVFPSKDGSLECPDCGYCKEEKVN